MTWTNAHGADGRGLDHLPHYPKVASSNLAPATKVEALLLVGLVVFWGRLKHAECDPTASASN